jgi:flagellar motor switch protein FliN/FliY
MTGEVVTAEVGVAEPEGLDRSALTIWRQPYSLGAETMVWVAVPPDTSALLAQRSLAAAGLSDASDADLRSTFLEILNQAMAGLCGSLAAFTSGEVSCGSGQVASGLPPGAVTWVALGLGAETAASIGFHVSDSMIASLAGPPEAPAPATAPASSRQVPALAPPPSSLPPAGGPATTASNLELLFDVELPVSVSFGRAYLALKEVLKLTSGSIVELNRSVAEPVEVSVNNCVIARGEVVVVEGNYGVRITQIVSQRERLRTLR